MKSTEVKQSLKFLNAIYNKEGNFLMYQIVQESFLKNIKELETPVKLNIVTSFHKRVTIFDNGTDYSLIFPLFPLLDKQVLLAPNYSLTAKDELHIIENFRLYGTEMQAENWSKAEKLITVEYDSPVSYFILCPKDLGKIEFAPSGLELQKRDKVRKQISDIEDRYLKSVYFHPYKKDNPQQRQRQRQQRPSYDNPASQYNAIFDQLRRNGML